MAERQETAEEPIDRLGMTDEQWASFQQATRGYGDQDENGIDQSLLRANLRLTPTERLQQHRRALILMQGVSRAGRDTRIWRNPTDS